MGIFEDLKNTKVTDTMFYMFFVLALTAPGTGYALHFHFDIFKELDSWKAFFMIVSMSTPLIISAICPTYIGNISRFSDEDGAKMLVFLCSASALMSGYGFLAIGAVSHWDFFFTAFMAVMGSAAIGLFAGFSTRFE